MKTQTRIILLAAVITALVAAGLYAGNLGKTASQQHRLQFEEIAAST